MAELGVWILCSGGSDNPQYSLGGVKAPTDAGQIYSQSMGYVSGDSITGITFLGSNGSATGNGTLSWNYGTGTLTWTENGGSPVSMVIGASGYYRFPSTKLVALKVVSSVLPTANKTGTYAIQNKNQNLLDNVQFAERSSNHRNFRCFYVRNNYAADIHDVTLSVVSPTYGTITVGSEYFSSYGTLSQEYVEHNGIFRETYELFAYARGADTVDKNIGGPRGMFFGAGSTPTVAQISDGLTTDLPATIVSETDPTNVLGNVQFSSQLYWPIIYAGTYVSFWVQRYVSMNTSGTDTVPDYFDLNLTYGRG